jgi:chaperonin GroEL (HSP60 family)
MKNVKVPRAITKKSDVIEGIQLHLFADASNLACCAATVAVVEHKSGTVKGLLTSKSRISKKNTTLPRLELVSGQMAANMASNLYHALL